MLSFDVIVVGAYDGIVQKGKVVDKAEVYLLAKISYNEPIQIFLRSIFPG